MEQQTRTQRNTRAQKLKEYTRLINQAEQHGISSIGLLNETRLKKQIQLRDQETKEQLYKYVYEGAEVNPLQDITDEYNKKLERLFG